MSSFKFPDNAHTLSIRKHAEGFYIAIVDLKTRTESHRVSPFYVTKDDASRVLPTFDDLTRVFSYTTKKFLPVQVRHV